MVSVEDLKIMPRRDIIHDAVRAALENDGWTITADPLYVKVEGGRGIEIDLGAEKLIAAEKGNEQIAVEIKSFLTSILNNFHQALGQYLDYRDALEEAAINREMYIALSTHAYRKIQDFPFLVRRTEKYDLKFIVVNIETKTIKAWKK